MYNVTTYIEIMDIIAQSEIQKTAVSEAFVKSMGRDVEWLLIDRNWSKDFFTKSWVPPGHLCHV